MSKRTTHIRLDFETKEFLNAIKQSKKKRSYDAVLRDILKTISG